jgi:hypothetical protein
MYTTALILGQGLFVAAWLALKAVPQWKRWNETVTGDDGTEIEGRAIYNVFLIGNALNIAFGAAGWKTVEWLRVGKITQSLILGVGLIVASSVFLLVAEISDPMKLRGAVWLWRFLEAYLNSGLFVIIMGLALLGIVGRIDGLATVTLIITALGGYVTFGRPWVSRPRLFVTSDITRWSPSDVPPDDTGSLFLRLQVGNYGWSSAKNCNARLNELRTSQGQHVDKFDALTLCWTRQDNKHERTAFSPVNIQRGGDYTFLDVAQVKQQPDYLPLRVRAVLPPPMTLAKGSPDSASPVLGEYLRAGTYYALITIYADNADSVMSWYEIICPVIDVALSEKSVSRYAIRQVSRPVVIQPLVEQLDVNNGSRQ